MTWTRETPTKPGAYWWRSYPSGEPVLLLVYGQPEGKMSCRTYLAWQATHPGRVEDLPQGGDWHSCLPPPVDGITLYGERLAGAPTEPGDYWVETPDVRGAVIVTPQLLAGHPFLSEDNGWYGPLEVKP